MLKFIIDIFLFRLEKPMKQIHQKAAAKSFSKWWENKGNEKSDFRYSGTMVYNTLPFPSLTEKNKAKIEKRAQLILEIRGKYPKASLATLYDTITMPPELRKAHQLNDAAVMEAYGFDWRNMSESECVEELFKLYEKLINK